jgi:hypothetical protein
VLRAVNNQQREPSRDAQGALSSLDGTKLMQSDRKYSFAQYLGGRGVGSEMKRPQADPLGVYLGI